MGGEEGGSALQPANTHGQLSYKLLQQKKREEEIARIKCNCSEETGQDSQVLTAYRKLFFIV